MLRAAATGRLDYSAAESGNPVWLARERLVLRYVEREAMADLVKQRHLQHVTTAVWPAGGSGELWRDHYNAGRDQLMVLGELLFPWVEWDEKTRYKAELRELKDEYIKKFGDPSTPEAKAQEQRDMETLKRRAVAVQQTAAEAARQAEDMAEAMRALRAKRYSRK